MFTCKSRACPSCGYRANVQWLRERWAALPDALYKGITFTMPDLLWPLFRDNPPLAKALPALAAEVIKTRVSVKYGLRVGVISILHTFNGELKFNSHVHTMVTGGGLHGPSGTWVSPVYYDHDYLMKSWRKAVIALVVAALRAGVLRAELTADQMEDLLTHLGRCWWSVRIHPSSPKNISSDMLLATYGVLPSRSVGSRASRDGGSGFGPRTRSCVAEWKCNAHRRSSSIAGPNTSRTTISTLFGPLGCLPRARSDKLARPSLPFWGRSKGHAPNLDLGQIR